MKIMIINPNSTSSMTQKIGNCATSVASPGTEIIATNPSNSPRSIEGHSDGALAIPGLLEEIRKGEETGVDGYIAERL